MRRILPGIVLAGAFAIGASFSAFADAIIYDGNVGLGVKDLGQLNVSGGVASVSGETRVGARYLPATGGEYEVTSHGCECEGWGVSGSGVSGYANNSSGTSGLVSDSFVSDATTATSVTSLTGGSLTVSHSFALSTATDNLYEVVVTITANADVTDVVYRRTMDWDTDPTPFNEYVTIGGTAAAALLSSSDDGFCSSNPLSSCTGILEGSGDFTASGPDDHGANFDFGFGDLLQGESVSFSIFYGGADNLTDALATMIAAGIEVYSLGWSGDDANQDGFSDASGAVTPTFIFGFKGVGGTVVGRVPEPGILFLMGFGLMGMGIARRKARRA